MFHSFWGLGVDIADDAFPIEGQGAEHFLRRRRGRSGEEEAVFAGGEGGGVEEELPSRQTAVRRKRSQTAQKAGALAVFLGEDATADEKSST